MKDRLKVLYLSSWFPSRVSPTNGDFVQRHAEATALLHDTHVLYVIADKNLNAKRKDTVHAIENAVKQHIVYFKKNRVPVLGTFVNKFNYLRYYVSGFKRITSEYGKPDIVHANITYPIIIISTLFKVLFNIPFVITEHWTKYLTPNPPLKKITRLLMRQCKMLLPVSENLGNAFVNHKFTTGFKVIPNVVDVSRFQLKDHRNKQLSFVHVSSMKEDQKNIIGIIKAFKTFSDKTQDVQLTFIGRHSSEQLALATDLDLLNKSVFFKGFINHSEIPAHLQSNDVLVLFSNYENLPCVIVEAFACGLPVITTAVGGIDEHIHKNNGILIKKGDIEGLIEAFEYLNKHIKTYNKSEIRQYAIENFSNETISKSFSDVYRAVLNKV